MAITTISAGDSIGVLVDGINQIAIDIGDVTNIATGDLNLVSGVNAIRNSFTDLDDSSEFVAAAKSAFSSTGTGDGSFSYASATGVFSFTGQTVNEARAHISATGSLSISNGQISLIDSSVENIHFKNQSIDIDKFDSVVTTEIKNSTGSTILTLRTIGS